MSTRFPFFVSEIPVSVPRVTRPSFKEAAGIVPERKPERQCSYLIETESSVRHCRTARIFYSEFDGGRRKRVLVKIIGE